MINLQFLNNPENGDWLYIIDINGSRNNKPRTKRITYETLLERLLSAIQEQVSSNDGGLSIPTVTKTIANASDFFIGIDNSNTAYKITKSNLLAGITSSENSGGIEWTILASSSTLVINKKYIIATTEEVTLTFPKTLGELEIYNKTDAVVKVALQGEKYNSEILTNTVLTFISGYARYLYLDNSIGWIALSGEISGDIENNNEEDDDMNYTVATENLTAVNKQKILCVNDNDIVITFPLSPDNGWTIEVIKIAGSGNVSLVTNAELIAGIPQSDTPRLLPDVHKGGRFIYYGNNWFLHPDGSGSVEQSSIF